MKNKTHTAFVVENADCKIQYDRNVKEVLSDKVVLAWILKYSVVEFKEFSIEEIMENIEGEPQIANIPLEPGGLKAESITGLSTESSLMNEGMVTYDIRFFVYLPSGERVKLIVNVEAQKNYTPGYDLVTRGVFYCARMLSSQLGTEFTTDNYDGIKKVFSIWICMKSPEYAKNTITQYSMGQHDIYGTYTGKARYDLLSVIMVRLGKNGNGKNELIGMLSTLLSSDMPVSEKKQILEKEYHIPMSRKLQEAVNIMCNLSDLVEEKGIEKGIKEGIKKGIKQGIKQGMEQGGLQMLYECVADGDLTIEKAAKKAGLEQEDFVRRMKLAGY